MARLQVYSADLDGERVRPNRNEAGNSLSWSASATHEFANNGRVILLVTTDSTASQTMTIESQLEVSGLSVSDREIDLTSSQTTIFGPFPPNIHNHTSGNDAGYTSVNFNAAGASVEVTAIRLP